MNSSEQFDGEKEHGAEDKESLLKKRLFEIQLQYAQKLLEKEIPSPMEDLVVESMSFPDALDRFTDVSIKIRDAYHARTGKAIWASDENFREFKRVEERVVAGLQDAYRQDSSGWIGRLDEIVASAMQELPEAEIPFREPELASARAGILRYDVGAGHSQLEEYGISPEDECVKTHLDPLFHQEGIAKGRKLSDMYREAYGKIAKELKEKYPKVKALVSESWLFDTSLAKELGLHVYQSANENLFRGTTFWGQFVTREGEINEERVQQLLTTGKPPFRVKGVYMMRDEFLDKYEPKE